MSQPKKCKCHPRYGNINPPTSTCKAQYYLSYGKLDDETMLRIRR